MLYLYQIDRRESESPHFQQFIYGDPDVFGDLSEKDRRNVAATMDRNCRASAVRVSELLMRSSLANFPEPPEASSKAITSRDLRMGALPILIAPPLAECLQTPPPDEALHLREAFR